MDACSSCRDQRPVTWLDRAFVGASLALAYAVAFLAVTAPELAGGGAPQRLDFHAWQAEHAHEAERVPLDVRTLESPPFPSRDCLRPVLVGDPLGSSSGEIRLGEDPGSSGSTARTWSPPPYTCIECGETTEATGWTIPGAVVVWDEGGSEAWRGCPRRLVATLRAARKAW